MTLGDLQARLRVDVVTGSCYWIDATKHHRNLIGKPAGHATRNARKDRLIWVIKLGGRIYKRAHIVFFVANGNWPNLIDHIDGNSLNDAAANLREATITQNNWNHATRRKSSTAPMGVRVMPSGRFQVRVACHKQTIYKTFAVLADAQNFYDAKRKELYGAYYRGSSTAKP